MAVNKKYYYFKLKDSFFNQEEIILLENMDDGYLYSNILLKLYLLSLKNEGKLIFKDKIPYNPTMLSKIVRQPVGIVEKALKIFEEMNLIEILESGTIFMTDIQIYVGKSSTEGDRKREYRARIEKEKKGIKAIEGQMSDNCQLEIETDTETETEKEKELNIELNKYGEFNNVFLSDNQYNNLVSRLNKGTTDLYINKLSTYMESTGKTYNNHYATIISWYISNNAKNKDTTTLNQLKELYDELDDKEGGNN